MPQKKQKEEYRQAVADYESRRNKEIFHTEDTSKVVINGTIRANGNFGVNPKNNNIELGGKHNRRPIYDKWKPNRSRSRDYTGEN